jgi:hypothetical protein
MIQSQNAGDAHCLVWERSSAVTGSNPGNKCLASSTSRFKFLGQPSSFRGVVCRRSDAVLIDDLCGFQHN